MALASSRHLKRQAHTVSLSVPTSTKVTAETRGRSSQRTHQRNAVKSTTCYTRASGLCVTTARVRLFAVIHVRMSQSMELIPPSDCRRWPRTNRKPSAARHPATTGRQSCSLRCAGCDFSAFVRCAHKDHAVLLVPAVLAESGDVHGVCAVRSGVLCSPGDRDSLALSESTKRKGGPRAPELDSRVFLDGPPRSPHSALRVARDRPFRACGRSPHRERPFRAKMNLVSTPALSAFSVAPSRAFAFQRFGPFRTASHAATRASCTA